MFLVYRSSIKNGGLLLHEEAIHSLIGHDLKGVVYITLSQEGGLILYSYKSWIEVKAIVNLSPSFLSGFRNFKKIVIDNVEKIEINTSGLVNIPEDLLLLSSFGSTINNLNITVLSGKVEIKLLTQIL